MTSAKLRSDSNAEKVSDKPNLKEKSSISSYLTSKKGSPLAVAVFDENKSVRFFQIQKDWLSSLGKVVILGAVILLALVFTVIHLGIKLRNVSPEYINQSMSDLESKVSLLNTENSELKKRLTEGASSSNLFQPNNVSTVDPEPSILPEKLELAAGKSSGLFNVFSAAQTSTLPTLDQIPIRITKPAITWRGGLLRARFFIQYVRGDKGNQQGRIVVFARGGSVLLSYPDNVFQAISSGSFIDIQEGETFSVSRIREVVAEFENVAFRSSLDQLQVMIFNMNDQLILSEIVPIPDLWGQARSSQRGSPSAAGTQSEGSNIETDASKETPTPAQNKMPPNTQ